MVIMVEILCCKLPRYVPHESKVMQNIVGRLDENIVVEEENGSWGALVVLTAKPHKENVPCQKYQWIMCQSYQKLNQVLLSFAFPIT